MLIGYYIVKAEPAVAVLTKQVEEVSNGSISQRAMGLAMSIGVCVSVGPALVPVPTRITFIASIAILLSIEVDNRILHP